MDYELPKAIGRFTIKRLLGEGGFARVFLAHDPQLQRDIALKVPHAHTITSENARARFQREARAVAILSHPAIVPVFESGTAGNTSYIATEYCGGQTLEALQRGSVEAHHESAVASLMLTLTEATEYSHSRGIIHRDLKPSNIVVSTTADALTDTVAKSARILDFGLARNLLDVDATLTTEGKVAGTPAYTAPELLNGSAAPSPQSDVYSLGVILYELLTGELPRSEISCFATMRSIDLGLPQSPRILRKEMSRDLEAITMKCLAEPHSRYLRAFDLQQDLERWLNGKAVSARRPNLRERSQKWYRRNRSFANACLFAFVSLSIGLVIATRSWWEAKQNLALARESIQNVRTERFKDIERSTKLMKYYDEFCVEFDAMDAEALQHPDVTRLREKLHQLEGKFQKDVGRLECGNYISRAGIIESLGNRALDSVGVFGFRSAAIRAYRAGDFRESFRYADNAVAFTRRYGFDDECRAAPELTGGTLSWLFGRTAAEEDTLLTLGFRQTELTEIRKKLRREALEMLSKTLDTDVRHVVLNAELWGPLYDDPEFQAICERNEGRISLDSADQNRLTGLRITDFMKFGKRFFGRR